MLELDGDSFGKKMECVGAGISGGGHRGPTRQGGAPCRSGRALDPRGQVPAPPVVFSVPYILKYSRKIILNWQGIWRTFIFGIFFIAWIIQKQIGNTNFALFILNNTK